MPYPEYNVEEMELNDLNALEMFYEGIQGWIGPTLDSTNKLNEIRDEILRRRVQSGELDVSD